MRTFLIFPGVEAEKLARLEAAAPQLRFVNAADAATAQQEIVRASGFFGKMTLELLAAARQLEWIQTPTASLEHYLFPALVEHPCGLSNMRGIFSDVIADHVLGYVLSVANSLAVADELPLAERESVPRALEKAVRGIDTGLRELARARSLAPEQILDRTAPLDLFRVGATVDPTLREPMK